MATIKAYTDLSQSKTLSKILPIKSADMRYICIDICKGLKYMPEPRFIKSIPDHADEYDVKAWSLVALLNLLPNEISTGERYCDKYQIDIRKYDGGDNTTLYQIAYGNNRGLSGSWHDMINTSEKESAIDACYEMIIKLHELKML